MPLVILTWGFGPPVTAFVTASPIAATFLRFWLAEGFLAGVIVVTRRERPMRVLLWSAPSGCCFALNNLSFFVAIQHASVVVVSLLFTLQSALVVVLGNRFLGERITRWQLAWTTIGVLGASRRGAARPTAAGVSGVPTCSAAGCC